MNSSEFMLNNQVYTQKMKKEKNQSERKNKTQQKAAQKRTRAPLRSNNQFLSSKRSLQFGIIYKCLKSCSKV